MVVGVILGQPDDRHVEIEQHRPMATSRIMLWVQKNDAMREPRVIGVT